MAQAWYSRFTRWVKITLDPRHPIWQDPRGRAAHRAVERLLHTLACLLAATQRLRGPGVGLALGYHRVAPAAGDPRLELLPAIASADFDAQVRHVCRSYQPVKACDLLTTARRRRRGQRLPVAITFDDDHGTHLRNAAPILALHRVPATFFLCGATLEQPRTFWWERLQRAADEGLLGHLELPGIPKSAGQGPGAVHAIAAIIEQMAPGERDGVDAALRVALGPDPPDAGLRAQQVGDLVRQGYEIGFHTRDHHPLPTLADAAVAEALDDGRAALEAAAFGRLVTVAYPNGRWDHRTPPAARAAGYVLGFTTNGTSLHPGSNLMLIGRIEPSSITLAFFALKLAIAPLRRGAGASRIRASLRASV